MPMAKAIYNLFINRLDYTKLKSIFQTCLPAHFFLSRQGGDKICSKDKAIWQSNAYNCSQIFYNFLKKPFLSKNKFALKFWLLANALLCFTAFY